MILKDFRDIKRFLWDFEDLLLGNPWNAMNLQDCTRISEIPKDFKDFKEIFCKIYPGFQECPIPPPDL